MHDNLNNYTEWKKPNSHKETFDFGDGFMNLYTSKLIKSCFKYMHSLLHVNYTSTKLFKNKTFECHKSIY